MDSQTFLQQTSSSRFGDEAVVSPIRGQAHGLLWWCFWAWVFLLGALGDAGGAENDNHRFNS